MLDKAKVREIAKQYTNKVRETYNPKLIILFGSHINGNPNEYSDIDIALIFDKYEGNWVEAWADLFSLREDISFDIEPHMLEEANDRSGFLEHIKRTGEIIYEEAS